MNCIIPKEFFLVGKTQFHYARRLDSCPQHILFGRHVVRPFKALQRVQVTANINKYQSQITWQPQSSIKLNIITFVSIPETLRIIRLKLDTRKLKFKQYHS